MFEIRWDNIEGLRRFDNGIKRLSHEFPKVLPQELNKVGRLARTVVRTSLAKQTGLKYSVVKRAVTEANIAQPGKLLYSLKSRGGFIRLKFFNAREARKGVSAAPFGKRRLFARTFIMGGQFPYRHVKNWNLEGHVYRRLGYGIRSDGTKGEKITQVKSDVRIPEEMIRGETVKAFNHEVNVTLPPRIENVIRKLLA